MTSRQPSNSDYDYILVGGGLQAGLMAMALNHHQPSASVLIVEKNDRLCGNHTWSFHLSDIPRSSSAWISKIDQRRWAGYRVQFPGLRRVMRLPYGSIASENFAATLRDLAEAGNIDILTGVQVADVAPDHVLADDGRCYAASLVVDCRGGDVNPFESQCGYQKFFGFEIELQQGCWPDDLPVLMDADLPQFDGFRFMYVLPMNSRRILLEQTRFSDTADCNRSEFLNDLDQYLDQRSAGRWEIVREESGCLPMPYGRQAMPSSRSPLAGGYAGGWFHAATGYSLPLAVRLADTIARVLPQQAAGEVAQLALRNRFQAKFSRFLNRMLFRMVQPNKRWQIFRRFYRVLPETSIERFYAHRFHQLDAMRLVFGVPPQGLTPIRFFDSFRARPCLTSPA